VPVPSPWGSSNRHISFALESLICPGSGFGKGVRWRAEIFLMPLSNCVGHALGAEIVIGAQILLGRGVCGSVRPGKQRALAYGNCAAAHFGQAASCVSPSLHSFHFTFAPINLRDSFGQVAVVGERIQAKSACASKINRMNGAHVKCFRNFEFANKSVKITSGLAFQSNLFPSRYCSF